MADHAECAEEQQYEAEALQAIYDAHFTVVSDREWQIELLPDMSDLESNHVACRLVVELPLDYPHGSLPKLSIQLLKGLAAPEHEVLLEDLARQEAQANEGVPSIFAVAERIKEWLLNNNVKGLDDTSMYAQSMRKQGAAPAAVSTRIAEEFEAQTQSMRMTEAEAEDYEVQKRRAEGTPCNKENFDAWKQVFEAEIAQQLALQEADGDPAGSKKGKDKKAEDKTGRVTGYIQFSGAAANLQALEAAADEAERDETPIIDEELFDGDEDLDDLDFDSDDEEEDDEEDLDI